MKLLVYLFAFCLLLFPDVYAQSSKKIKERDRRQQEFVSFFRDYLSGKEIPYTTGSSVRITDIEQEQALVWEAWKQANNEFKEEKLMELNKLSEKKAGKLSLPEELEANALMPYYFGTKGEKPEAGFPLFVYLHGSGPKDHEWETGFQLGGKFDDAPSVYFIPQIPSTDNYRWYPRSKQFALEKLLRLSFVSGEMDANRVYFFGISEGGYGSQRLASFYADYLAGAGPMAGGEPLKNAPVENCRNTAFSLRTGANDVGFYRNILTGYTKNEFEKWQKKYPGSFVHWVELIPGMNHGIDYFPTPLWLKKHTRDPYPKFVSWENFEMDNRYRKGFYNIAVNERSNEDHSARTYYELQIDGNNLSLRADLVTYKTVETDPRWGIEMKFEKSYTPATQGKLTIYLCKELVDLNQEITLNVNGREVFKGKVKPDRKHMVNSCATFFDPARIYPAAIEVDLGKLK